MNVQEQKIDRIFKPFTKNKQIHEAVLYIENTDGSFSYHNEAGEESI